MCTETSEWTHRPRINETIGIFFLKSINANASKETYAVTSLNIPSSVLDADNNVHSMNWSFIAKDWIDFGIMLAPAYYFLINANVNNLLESVLLYVSFFWIKSFIYLFLVCFDFLCLLWRRQDFV